MSGSLYDGNILPNPSSDFETAKLVKEYQHQKIKGKQGIYNFPNYRFRDYKINNLQNLPAIPRDMFINPLNGVPTQPWGQYTDFQLPLALNNGSHKDFYVEYILYNTQGSVATLSSAPFHINYIQTLRGGTNDATSQITNATSTIWLENCLDHDPGNDAWLSYLTGMSALLTYSSSNTIPANSSRSYVVRIPSLLSRLYFPWNALGTQYTLRVWWQTYINYTMTVTTPQINMTGLFLRQQYLEIDNFEFANIMALAMNGGIDYKIYNRANQSQVFQFQSGIAAGSPQTCTVTSINGDSAGLLVWIENSNKYVGNVVGVTPDVFYPIQQIVLTDNNNFNLMNNANEISSDGLKNLAVKNTDHTFFANQYVYLLPFSTNFVDALKYNAFTGLVRLQPPSIKLTITVPATIGTSVQVVVVSYTSGILRLNNGLLTLGSS